MTNIIRIARWELLRTLRNKTIIISIVLTPILILLFSLLPTLITFIASEDPFTLYVYDEYGVMDQLQPLVMQGDIILVAENDPSLLETRAQETPQSGYTHLDAESISTKNIIIYTYSEGELAFNDYGGLPSALHTVFRDRMLLSFGLTQDQILDANTSFTITQQSLNPKDIDADPLKKYIPAILAGVLYFNIFISASLMFSSVMQEKKDRMVEIILYSVPARQFMQGKILGHFLLSLLQITLWLIVTITASYSLLHFPLLTYLATWQIIPIILFTFSGYLLYFSCFAAIGATIEDTHSGSGFQSFIMMMPLLPIFFIGPVILNPSGNIAVFCSYFPFTSSLVLPLRAALTHSVPLTHYLLGGAILALTCLLIMVASGKIFRASILQYGKNASVSDMFRWLINKS